MVFTISVKSWTLLMKSNYIFEGENSDNTCWIQVDIKIPKADLTHLTTSQSYLNQDCAKEIFYLPFMIWILVYEIRLNMLCIKKDMIHWCFVISKAVPNLYLLVAFLRWATRLALSDDFLMPAKMIFAPGKYLGFCSTPSVISSGDACVLVGIHARKSRAWPVFHPDRPWTFGQVLCLPPFSMVWHRAHFWTKVFLLFSSPNFKPLFRHVSYEDSCSEARCPALSGLPFLEGY